MHGVEPIADADEQARRQALAYACLDGAYAPWRPRHGDAYPGRSVRGTDRCAKERTNDDHRRHGLLLIAGGARAGARQLEHLAELTGAGELIIDAASEFGERRSARDFLADITNSADNR
jgi:hypothetical protein